MKSYNTIRKQYYQRAKVYNDRNNLLCKSSYIEGWMDALDWVMGGGENIISNDESVTEAPDER